MKYILIVLVLVLSLLVTTEALASQPDARKTKPDRGTVAYCKKHARGNAERACIIRVVFAPVGQSRKAVQVAWCESRFDPHATNGQYLGVFQVSSYWRSSVPGWGMSVEQQARHALRIYRRVGSRWSPTWACA